MISKKMADGIIDQVNREIFSAYLYLAMASYAQDIGLSGVASWFYVQLQEELSHAKRLSNYLEQKNVRLRLKPIESPSQDFSSVTDLFKQTLEHEEKVTSMIDGLINMAIDQKDRATEIMLQWFVTEQVEEESSVQEILQKLKLFGEKGDALLMIDSQLAQRTFSPPVGQ